MLHPQVPFLSTTPPTASHAPSATINLPMMKDTPTGSPTRPCYENQQWWQIPFGEVDSDVDKLSPSHSF